MNPDYTQPILRPVNGRCRAHWLIPALALLLLAGCATPRLGPPVTSPVEWDSHRNQIAALEHWELRGKLGYRGPDANGSAWLTWLQDFESFDLTLSGPMGAGATRISGNPQLAVLQRGSDQARASSPSELTREVLGVRLPLEELPWWVRGLPAPDTPSTPSFGENHLLASLEQAGWQLAFSRYADVDGFHLPGRITGTGTGPHEGLSFTLVVNQWRPMDDGGESPP